MAVAFDAAATGSGYPPSPGFSFSHALGAASGNNRIVLVAVNFVGGTSHTSISVTYNGTAMTQLTFVSQSYFSRISSTRFYYLLDSSLPASAGSYTVAVVATGPYDGVAIAASYTGVVQSTPPYASASNNGNPLSGGQTTNITIASTYGRLVDAFGMEAQSGGSISPGASQTERGEITRSTNCTMNLTDKAYTSSGANSMAETPSSTYYYYGHILVELQEIVSDAIAVVGYQGYATASGTSVSGSYTCHAGENRRLLVAAGGEYTGGGINVTSVTYNGVPLTKINEYDHPATYNNISWWVLDHASFPATPGAYTLQANFNVTVNPGHMGVLELTGVAQDAIDEDASTNAVTTNTLNTPISTYHANSMIAGAIISGADNTYTPQSGQTEDIDQQGGGGGCSFAVGHETITAIGATNMQWQASASVNRLLQMVIVAHPASECGNSTMFGCNW